MRVIKLRRMRWAGHVARMEEGRGVHKVLVGNLRERVHCGDQDVDGRIILRWILEVGRGCGDCMELTQDRDRWQALVSTVMNFGVP